MRCYLSRSLAPSPYEEAAREREASRTGSQARESNHLFRVEIRYRTLVARRVNVHVVEAETGRAERLVGS